MFGFNADDLIDTFSRITLSSPIKHLIATANEYYPTDQINIHSLYKLSKVHFGIAKQDTFNLEINALLDTSLDFISFNFPYFSLSVDVDDAKFAHIYTEYCQLKEGVLSVNTLVQMGAKKEITVQTDGKQEIPVQTDGKQDTFQHIMSYLTNIVFRRPQLSFPVLKIHSILFGASSLHYHQLASTFQLSLDTNTHNAYIQSFCASSTESLFELYNLDAKVLPTGIEAYIEFKGMPSWFPFTTDLSMMASVVYDMNNPVNPNTLEYTHRGLDVILRSFKLTPGQPGTLVLLLKPRSDDALLDPLEHAILRLLQYQDYAEHAMIGLVSFINNDSISNDPSTWALSVNAFQHSLFSAPELYLWRPITTTVHSLINEDIGKTLVLDIHFPNPGPLQIDIGRIQGTTVFPFHRQIDPSLKFHQRRYFRHCF
jgi:hypothetical protein